MSLLAAPRKKQKISVDPQNLIWKNDTNGFGKRMLEKAGWKDGDGLGKSRQGIAENLKLKANLSNKGLGYSHQADSNWSTISSDFSDLLSRLNREKNNSKANNSSTNVKSIEKHSAKANKRLHRRMRRGRNLGDYSSAEKIAIFGISNFKNDGISSDKSNDDPMSCDKEEYTVIKVDNLEEHNLIVSEFSISDYFAGKSRDSSKMQKIQ